jgi:hypothetical protein
MHCQIVFYDVFNTILSNDADVYLMMHFVKFNSGYSQLVVKSLTTGRECPCTQLKLVDLIILNAQQSHTR